MERNNFLKNKKAIEIVSTRLIVIILGILVLVAAALALTSPKILDSIRNLPGYEIPDDTEKELTPDDLRLLNYEPVGKVSCEKFAVFGTRCKIYYLERKLISESECRARNYEWKKACYDSFGFISDKEDNSNCKSYGEGILKDGCFDSAGFTVYDEKYLEPVLYWDYDRGDSYNGDVRVLEGVLNHNSKVGEIKNYFLIFDDNLYNRMDNKVPLLDMGFTSLMKEKLNGAKYIGGKLYKSK